mmetsp:Transcript_15533/g.16829  ORF Transcript_15533/g.16829 Transcript_15533/m.16829 type:complete len:224 (-) Transcript_15533:2951-3622(-)
MTEKVFPPLNFTMIEDNLYRSALPSPINYPFIKTLKLKTILVLSQNTVDDNFLSFCKENEVNLIPLRASSNTSSSSAIPASNNITPSITGNPTSTVQPQAQTSSSGATSLPDSESISEETVTAALRIIADARNYPLLLTCRSGRSQSGVVVGCLRKLLRWSLISVFEEYRRFSNQHLRLTLLHEAFIEQYDTETLDAHLAQDKAEGSDVITPPSFLAKYRTSS